MRDKLGTQYVIKETARRMDCSYADARELLGHFSSVILENVAQGRSVGYSPLGVFYRSARESVRGPALKLRCSRPARRMLRLGKKPLQDGQSE
ncbi:MAG: hypothetical protein QXI12_10750 [Candidatus Methanomethyliaceae archaeon]